MSLRPGLRRTSAASPSSRRRGSRRGRSRLQPRHHRGPRPPQTAAPRSPARRGSRGSGADHPQLGAAATSPESSPSPASPVRYPHPRQANEQGVGTPSEWVSALHAPHSPNPRVLPTIDRACPRYHCGQLDRGHATRRGPLAGASGDSGSRPDPAGPVTARADTRARPEPSRAATGPAPARPGAGRAGTAARARTTAQAFRLGRAGVALAPEG